MKKNTRRFGRHLPTRGALSLLKHDQDLLTFHQERLDLGYTLKNSVRPYLNKSGRVSVKFVWRKRTADSTVTVEKIIRFQLA